MLFHCVWCFFFFFSAIAAELLMRSECATNFNDVFVCSKCRKENRSALFRRFFFHYFGSSLPPRFGICWKHYCNDVQNYFSLPSFTSVVCHLKLSYYHHFVYISCTGPCVRVFQRHLTYRGPNKLELELCLFSFAFGMCNPMPAYFLSSRQFQLISWLFTLLLFACNEGLLHKQNSKYLHA